MKRDMNSNTSRRYGVLGYSSMNIGDEIQSLAAMRFLPRVDTWIHRERVDQYRSDVQTKLILNAWWMWKVDRFPPSPDIDALPISMHLRPDRRKEILSSRAAKWMKANGPIGCRDIGTLEFLRAHDIPAYHSNCLTLTLQPDATLPKKDLILCVDVPKEVVKSLRRRTEYPVQQMSQILTPYLSQLSRIEVARAVLGMFQSARAVVSTRLHALLPSVALGTPALRIKTGNEPFDADARFAGTERLFSTVDVGDFLQDQSLFDPELHLTDAGHLASIQQELVDRCSSFSGYDNQQHDKRPGIDPAVRLLQAIKHDKTITRRNLYFAPTRELFRAAFARQLRGRSKHDV